MIGHRITGGQRTYCFANSVRVHNHAGPAESAKRSGDLDNSWYCQHLAATVWQHLLLSLSFGVPAVAAFAGHTIVSNLFPWNQGKFDVLIAKQLKGVSDAELTKAEAVAVPIALKLLKER